MSALRRFFVVLCGLAVVFGLHQRTALGAELRTHVSVVKRLLTAEFAAHRADARGDAAPRRAHLSTAKASILNSARRAALPVSSFTVTPATQSVSVSPNTRQQLSFVITNVSSANTAFDITPTCTGAAVTACSPFTRIGVAVGQSSTLEVDFRSGAPTTTGTMTITVIVGTDTVLGTYTVTTNPVYGVSVTPVTSIVTPAASATGTVAYSVTNTGSTATTYTLAASCPGGTGSALVSCSAPASVMVAAGATSFVNVTYQAASTVNRTSQLLLTATYGDVTATGVATVTIASAGIAVDVVSINPGSAVARDQCLTFAAGKEGAYECGNLRLTHPFQTVRTRNKSRTPTLLYNSQFAAPYPLIAANVTLASVPDQVTATLTINGATRATGSWTGSDWTANSTRHIVLGYDAAADTTGAYSYTMTVTSITGGISTATTATGTVIVLNRVSSPFGAGWWIAGLEQVIPLANGERLWVGGDGSARVYHVVTANAVWAADPVDRPDTLKLFGSTYIRYAEHGVQVQFNLLGQHIYTLNRLNDTTKFVYTGSNLTSIILPSTAPGITYTFSYTAGRLSSVASLGRTTTLGYTDLGRINAITDPDTRTVLYGYYTGTTRMLVRTDRNGHKTWYGYNVAWQLANDSTPIAAPGATTATNFHAQEGRGFMGYAAVPLTTLRTIVDGPLSGIGDTTLFFLDRFGAPVKIIDALGDTTVLQKANTVFPALVTAIRRANGFTTVAQYDARGNLTKSTDLSLFGNDVNAITQYQWDPKWDYVTSVRRPEGDRDSLAYDATNGNLLWQQDGRGLSGRTTFSYFPTGSGADTWLLHAVQSPSGRMDTVVYYNALRNVSATRSPNGVWMYRNYDSFGRVLNTRVPTNAAQTVFQEDSTYYDAMDRVTRTVSMGGTQRGIAVFSYDNEGNPTQIQRTASDNPSLGTLTTQSRYDAADRLVASVAVGGNNVDSTMYDAVGNPIQTISRLKDTVVMTYDVLNRLTRRVSPKRLLPVVTETGYGSYPRYPNTGTMFHTIPADTATFIYDVTGQMTRATNIGAIVSRTYYPNGQLATDTQVVRTYSSNPNAWGSTTSHRYGLGYVYDRDGRRTELRHPFLLSGGYTSRTTYSYDPSTGWLVGLVDMKGNSFTITYDSDGRPIGTLFPGGVRDSTVYNLDDAVTRRIVFNTSTRGNGYSNFTLLSDEAMIRDVRGKLTTVVTAGGITPIDTSGASYSTLGHLIGATRRQPYATGTGSTGMHAESESFTLDGLGNLLTFNSSVLESQPGSSSSSFSNAGYTYQAATGRMLSRTLSGSPGGTESYAYDSAGDQTRLTSSGTPSTLSRSYYDGLGKLVLVDQRTLSGSDNQWHYDEFIYDALGRMVATRSRTSCTAGFNPGVYYSGGGGLYYVYDGRCKPKMRRTVWDGAQLAWEIQYDGGTGTGSPAEYDGGWNLQEIGGKVSYLNAGAIDKPLSVLRFDYESGTAYRAPTPTLIVPHYNWKGTPVFPTFEAGQVEKCATWGTSPPQCVAVSWPGMKQSYERTVAMEVSWHGSFVDQSTQGSGLQYKRNRFYDPNTGRFTQEDPSGLGGGLNSYGFAAGDPINFSDPFGLCPIAVDGIPCTAEYAPGVSVSSGLMHLALDAIAEEADVPLIVYSGNRDRKKNATVGGATRSGHLQGTAADVIFKGKTKKQTLNMLYRSSARKDFDVRLLYHQKGSSLPEHSHLDLREGGDITEQQLGESPKYVPLEEPFDFP